MPVNYSDYRCAKNAKKNSNRKDINLGLLRLAMNENQREKVAHLDKKPSKKKGKK